MSNANPPAPETGDVDQGRRALLAVTCAAGGAATVATLVPFVASMNPSERAKAAGAPVEADISKLAPGQLQVVEWRGKPVWVLRRTPEMLATLKEVAPQLADPESKKSDQPKYATNETRAEKDEYLVVVGSCTHLGCSPTAKFEPADPALGADWKGGFLCPCHGSRFDFAGRVFANMPAPTNLPVPPYKFLTDTTLVIGEDATTKGA